MAIPDEVIEQVRLSSDIVSIIRDYVPDLKKAGRNWKACCPFHSEKTPSFVVSEEKGIFRCFGCGSSGDVFKFLMLAEHISWIEAVKKLAQKNGITVNERYTDKIAVSERTKIFEILEAAAKFYHRYFLESNTAKFAREYASKRGMTSETIKKFMIGYCHKGKLIESAAKKGYDYKILSKAGLLTKTENGTVFEYMSERLVFPIFDVQGRVVAFGGRTLADSKAKYLNTPETQVYSKSHNLYGLFQALPELRKEKKIVLVEGYMDVVLSQQYGVIGAVAPLGTAFTQQQAKLISRYSDSAVLLFDPDEAGRTATQRALEICAENNVAVVTSSLPENVDPDEYLIANGINKFYKLLEQNLKSPIKFMTERVVSKTGAKTAQAKAKAVAELLDFIAKNKNVIVQRDYVKYISQNLGIEEDILWHEFKKKVIFKADKSTESLVKVPDEKKVSLEEELLKLLINPKNRHLMSKINSDFFTDKKCLAVYNLISSKNSISVPEILSSFEKNNAEWFSGLVMEADSENVDNNSDVMLEEKFSILCKDIEVLRLKERRKILENEILLMTEGKIKMDPVKIREYNELTKEIKGSGKK